MPASYKLELHGLIEAQKEAERVLRQMSGQPMVDAMHRATMLVQRTARQEAKVDRGIYRASIVPTVEAGPTTVTGVVGSNVAYAPFAVLDTKPHWPPIAAIIEWLRRKTRVSRARESRAMRHFLPGRAARRIYRAGQETELRSAAFLIARAISRRGTKGDYSLVKGVERNAPAIRRVFEQAVRRIVGD